jgi:hypothetical protein
MAIRKAVSEIEGIVERATDLLLTFISETGRAGAELRYAVGDLQARINVYVVDGSFGARVLNCFTLATEAGITVDWLDKVLEQLTSEQPAELTAVLVTQYLTLMALAQDGRILAATEFTSREDVEDMLTRMKNWFDITQELASDQADNPAYAALISLSGAITRYLSDVARPLPRMLDYQVVPMPALALSQFLYHVGDRSDELVDENKIVHPAFCPNQIRGLSA